MAKNSFQFKGFKELGQVLDALPGRLGPQTVLGILKKGAKPMVEEARRLASNADVTGDLTRSIGAINGRGRGKGMQVYVGPRRGGGFKGYHGHLLEYGTAPHRIKPINGKALSYGGSAYAGVNHPGTAAQPFMRPAFDAKNGQTVQIIKDEVAEIIATGFKNIKF
ncbi:HK97-gp10 family putative phage morphogenesis protein [Hymenobacter sp. HD11105]